MSDCRCVEKRGIVCALHAFRASDLDSAAEWLALAASEDMNDREGEHETHYVRVSPETALEVSGYAGIEVDWRDVAETGEALVAYPAFGDSRYVSEVSLVPSGLMQTDAAMRDVLRDGGGWSRFADRDTICKHHGNPTGCEACKVARKAASNERLVKARAALKAKRAAAKSAPVLNERERISNETRERIGVLPLD